MIACRCDSTVSDSSTKIADLEQQVQRLIKSARDAGNEGQSLGAKGKARESLLNTKVHQLTRQLEHERSDASSRHTLFTKRESQVCIYLLCC